MTNHAQRAMIIGVALLLLSSTVGAVPVLQLYVEGAVYDDVAEDWIIDGGRTARIWVIGNTGANGDILDVRLSAAYDEVYFGDVNIELTSTLIGGTGSFDGFTDSFIPVAPTEGVEHEAGTVPLLGDGSELPSHGVYGDDTVWQEFSLGDMSEVTTDPIADFIDGFPTSFASTGQINAYDFVVTGGDDDLVVHFDLYDHVQAGNHVRFVNAPFSHDGGTKIVPAPLAAPAGLLGMGLVLLLRRRRRAAK